MSYLWLLTESDDEDFIFEALVEKITGRNFQVIPRRLTGARGIGGVRKNLPLFVKDIERTGHLDESGFVIAIDNDRAVGRSGKILRRLEELMGPRAQWPIRGAIAIPVEMIESWVLLASGRHGPEEELPRFSSRTRPGARRALGTDCPPQLKDLVEAERQSVGGSRGAYMLDTLLACNPEELCLRSASFREFCDQLRSWND